jgi:hypothetical protein
MFSATLSKEIRPVCKKFMQDVGNYDRNYYWGKVQKIRQNTTYDRNYYWGKVK